MTNLTANFSFHQDDLDLNRLVRFGDGAFFFEDADILFNGVRYRDVVEALWSDTDFRSSAFGGSNIQVNSRGDITGGTVTGYLESVLLNGQYVISFIFQDLSISAERIYNAALTPSTIDDEALLRELLVGDDLLSMSSGNDFADGLGGDDIIRGFGGDDTLRGGDGNDTLDGGFGNNMLNGGAGNDRVEFTESLSSYQIVETGRGTILVSSNGSGDLNRVSSVEQFAFADQTLSLSQIRALISGSIVGTAQNDNIHSGGGDVNIKGLGGDDKISSARGNDTLEGGSGNDRIKGGGGDDNIKGGRGDDTIKGGGGSDNIKGNGGSDVIKAGGGADTIKGGGGADVIIGGRGDDVLQGGGGNDTITGNGGNDTLKGNGGADVFQFRASDRNDTILDFRHGQDLIEIQTGANSFAALDIEQDGQNVLIGFGTGQVRVVTDSVGAFDENDFIF